MAEKNIAIDALERVLITVEAELTALHTGTEVDRVDLERRLRTELTSITSTPASTAVAGNADTPSAPVPVPAAAVPPPPFAPPPPQPATPSQSVAPSVALQRVSPSNSFEKIFRIGGISLVVLAAVFFVSTAITRGWLGPTGQLVIASVASLLAIGQSFRFSEPHRPWKKTFAIGGAAGLFVSGVVGHFGLDILSIDLTLAWLGATVISFLALGRAHSSETVAACGAPAAIFGTALFAASGDGSPLIMSAIGICWGIAALTASYGQRWYIARAAAGAATGFIILLAASLEEVTRASALGTLIGVATVICFAVLQSVDFELASGEAGRPGTLAQIEARVAAITTPWTALVISILIAGDIELFNTATSTVGTFAIGLGAVVAVSATLLANRIHGTMIMLHQVAGIGTATVGFVVLLDGPILIAALLSQAIVTAVLASRYSAVEMIITSAVLTGITTIWAAFVILGSFVSNPLDLGEIVVTGLVIATLGAGSYLVRTQQHLERAWMLAWGAYLLWVAAALQDVPQAQMAISLTWAASAVLLLVIPRVLHGSIAPERFTRLLNVALGTLVFIGGKLIFVDLVSVDVLWRAALFFLMGATFLRLAFVLPEFVETMVGSDDDGDGNEQPPEQLIVPPAPPPPSSASQPSQNTPV